MEIQQLKKIIEGALLAAGKPLQIDKIQTLFPPLDCPPRDDLEAALSELSIDCADRGFELKKVSSGYRFQVRQEFSEWVSRLWEEKPQRYSRALMETLSIIAYRQPITRGDIEKIRGVAVSTQIVQTLLEHEWVRVVGHRDVPGRPALYATTRQFLDYFNLESLEQLPPLAEIRDLAEIHSELGLVEDKPSGRIIEFPEPEPSDKNEEVDQETEAAAAIGLRPISEILGYVDAQMGIISERNDDKDEANLENDPETIGHSGLIKERMNVSSNLTGSQKTATDSRTSRLDPENPTGINLDETDAE
jgi:segregation and condensation protein B